MGLAFLIKSTLLSGTSITTNTTVKTLPSSHFNFSRGRNNFSRGRGRGRGRHNGRGILLGPRPPFSPFYNRSVCQVCQKGGHITVTCSYRFDQCYQSPPPQSLTANYTAITLAPSHMNTWFPDSAASHHFKSELQNLNLDLSTYQGPETMSIGDGFSLPIHNTGSAQFSSNTGKFSLT